MDIRKVSFLCFVVFLTLKLCGGVDWSWGYVCLPAAALLGAIFREAALEKALGRDLTDV